MNFDLTEERQMLQDSLRRFLADRYTTALRNDILAGDLGHSPEIWQQLADLGMIGALFDDSLGGFGGAGFDLTTVFEECGRAGVVEPLLDTAVLAGGLIARLGRDDQLTLLQQVMSGELQLALAHGEVDSRYDATHVSATAVEADGQITLNGRKTVVVNAEAADFLLVTAREFGAVDAAEGISLFLVPRGVAGLHMQGYALLAGGRAAEVELDRVTLPTSARLGAAEQAAPALAAQLAAATVASLAETLGAMETATELTRDYLQTRQQFGRPIGSFQTLQHRMADLWIELEQARSAVINAAGHLADPDLRDRHVCAAANLVARVGRLVSEETIQLHGGIAMTQDYALAHFAKRIVMASHRFGDEDTQMERFIDLAIA